MVTKLFIGQQEFKTKINHYDLTLKQLKTWNCLFHSLSVGEKPFYEL